MNIKSIESSLNNSSISSLKEKVGHYVDFMRILLKNRSKVLFAGQIDRNTLQAMLDSNKECSGIRVYLTKGSSDNSKDDLGFLFIPVKGDIINNTLEDILLDGDSTDKDKFNLSGGNLIFMTDVECPSDVCRPPRGSKLVPDNY